MSDSSLMSLRFAGRYPAVAAGIGSAAVAALLTLPGLIHGPSLDAAVFTLVADRARLGLVPYVDTWDHKPPGIYVGDAAAQVLVRGEPWLAAWILTVIALGVAGLLMAITLRRLGYGWEALVAPVLAVAGSAQYVISLGGGLTEQLAVMPAAGALVLVVPPGRTLVRWAAAGAFAGLALSTSIPALPVIVVVLVLAGAEHRRVASAAAAVAGFVATGLAALAVVVLLGALPAALDAVVRYSVAFRATSASAPAAQPAQAAAVTLALVFLVLPAASGALALRRRSRDATWWLGVASLAWIAVSLTLFALQGRFETHYAGLLPEPLGFLAAAGLHEMSRTTHRQTGVARVLPFAPLALGIILSVAASTGIAGPMVASVAAESDRTALVGAYARDRTAPTDAIFVWGNEPQVYLDAGRAAASPYIYVYPLITQGYSSPAQISDLLANLQSSPPRLVIDAGSFAPGTPGLPPLLVARPVSGDGRDYDALDPLRSWVRANYGLLANVDGWLVYGRSGLP